MCLICSEPLSKSFYLERKTIQVIDFNAHWFGHPFYFQTNFIHGPIILRIFFYMKVKVENLLKWKEVNIHGWEVKWPAGLTGSAGISSDSILIDLVCRIWFVDKFETSYIELLGLNYFLCMKKWWSLIIKSRTESSSQLTLWHSDD